MADQSVTASYDKMKTANDREDRVLRQRIHEITKERGFVLCSLHNEKCELTQRLRAQKSRELRSLVRDALKQERDEAAKLPAFRRPQRPLATRVNPRLFQTRKGFSKLMLSEDRENDRDQFKKSTRSAYTRRHEESGDGENDKADDKPPLDMDPLILYYPMTPSNPLSKPTIGKPMYLPPLDPPDSPLRFVCPVNAKPERPKRIPTYVNLLRTLHRAEYDQYTDGKMALEMRVFQQKQRERLPRLAGHLPCRVRHERAFNPDKNLSRIRKQILGEEIAEDDPAAEELNRSNTLGVLDPSKLRLYIPRRGEEMLVERERTEVALENRRLQKLRQVEQARKYSDTLMKAQLFLGKKSDFHTQVPQESLTREEELMLHTMRMVCTLNKHADILAVQDADVQCQ